MAKKRLTLTDKQLIHKLYNDYSLNQTEIAQIVGCHQTAVGRVLKKPLPDIEDTLSFAELYPPNSGCYRTAFYDSEEHGLQVYQQSVGYPYDDPTFDSVADMEEDAPD